MFSFIFENSVWQPQQYNIKPIRTVQGVWETCQIIHQVFFTITEEYISNLRPRCEISEKSDFGNISSKMKELFGGALIRWRLALAIGILRSWLLITIKLTDIESNRENVSYLVVLPHLLVYLNGLMIEAVIVIMDGAFSRSRMELRLRVWRTSKTAKKSVYWK